MKNSLKKPIPTLAFLGLTTFLFQADCFADRKWDSANNPRNLDPNYSMNFTRLPLSGEANMGNRGWSDSYWPKVNGYIADRWQDKSSYYKDDVSPSISEVKSMSRAEIDILSPAEKFDIFRGKTDYPVANVLRKKLKRNDYDWRGLCNGWVQASLNIDEPHPIEIMSKRNGIKVPFGSADIKGLLAYYYYHDLSSAKYVGSICTKAKKFLFDVTGACKDVHPAALHVVMANEIGLKHKGFTADKDRTVEVWNQPYVKYVARVDNIKTSNFSKDATDGTRKEVTVTAIMTYVNELYDTDDEDLENSQHVAPSYEPVLGTPKQKYRDAEYRYVLELDRNDNIIGGEWISEERPDLIWRQDFSMPTTAVLEDDTKDDWSSLNELLKMATAYSR